MTTASFQAALLSQDYGDARRYWEGREVKKWAVHASIRGSLLKPRWERVYYASAGSSQRAIEAVKAQACGIPSGASFAARLAGPRELGCQPTRDGQHG